MNSTAIKLSEDIIRVAGAYAHINSRSVPKQIEHWAKIGKIAEENPDLPYEFIQKILEARQEIKTEKPMPYVFG
ncbi:MAG: ParD-like family protein [Treponema sp.]|nr:ParD-like family protein [Treponema sp.]